MLTVAVLLFYPTPRVTVTATSLAWKECCSTFSLSSFPHLTTALPPKPRLQLFPRDKAGLTSQKQVNTMLQPRNKGRGKQAPPQS